MTTAATLRVTAVLDATGASAERHARALGGFLAEGLEVEGDAEVAAVTRVFAAEGAADHLVGLAPTRDVRLVHAPPHRQDIVAAALTAFETGGGADLYLLPAGPSGTEVACRLAARTGGSVVTGVLGARFAGGHLTCRRPVFAGHLTGGLALGPRPWCLVLDAAWADTRPEPAGDHVVEAEELPAASGASDSPPVREIEALEAPDTGDLEAAAFLVVAGRGAGSRAGVDRIAAAAARLGAAFGATRPVVMNAWAGPDRQIGVSGTRTAPAVCVVAGASGAPALMWGIERAGFIAAVDTDEDASIAGECDAFVAGDAVAVLEALATLVSPAEDEP